VTVDCANVLSDSYVCISALPVSTLKSRKNRKKLGCAHRRLISAMGSRGRTVEHVECRAEDALSFNGGTNAPHRSG